MKNKINQIEGIVVSKKANYLFVDIDTNHLSTNILEDLDIEVSSRLLCTQRSRLAYSESFVSVGDRVLVEAISFSKATGVVCKIFPRSSFF